MIRHPRPTFVDQLTGYHGFALDVKEEWGVGGRARGIVQVSLRKVISLGID